VIENHLSDCVDTVVDTYGAAELEVKNHLYRETGQLERACDRVGSEKRGRDEIEIV